MLIIDVSQSSGFTLFKGNTHNFDAVYCLAEIKAYDSFDVLSIEH
jgi:hypothetical protein